MALAMLAWAPFALALSPYIKADSVTAGDLNAVMAQVEKKLQAGGFTVVGKHQPQGIAGNGVVIVTDKAILDTIELVARIEHRLMDDTMLLLGDEARLVLQHRLRHPEAPGVEA